MTREEAIAAGDVRSLTKLLRAELQRNAPNIPDTLKKPKIWLNWKVTKTNATSGKFDKVPFYPASQRKRHGQQGGDNDLANLGTWAEAWVAFSANPDIAGVGVAMLPEFGLVALDADKCICGVAEGIVIADAVSKISDTTYSELSPSRNGVRAFWLGTAQDGKNHDEGFELFHAKGFVTVTGDCLTVGEPDQLKNSMRAQLERMCNSSTSRTAEGTPSAPNLLPPHPLVEAQLRRLAYALAVIGADDRELWVRMGYALKTLGEAARPLWHEWSARSVKYDRADADRVWASFQPDRTGCEAVFAEARRCGWSGTAPRTGSEGGDPVPLDLKSLPMVPPAVAFLIPGWLPANVVTLFSAHGGAGKSFISLYVAICVAVGRHPFRIGEAVPRQRVVLYSAEDDTVALQGRLRRYLDFLRVDPSKLEGWLLLLDATACDNVLFKAERDGCTTTARFEWLAVTVQTHQAELVIFDNASDALEANENDRTAVRQFFSALRRLKTTVLLLSHVDAASSMAKPRDAKGYSGSTAWNNSARSRWFLTRDENGLTMTQPKVNYARAGSQVAFQWDGAHQVFAVTGCYDEAPTGKTYRAVLLKLIADVLDEGTNISISPNATNNAFALIKTRQAFPRGLDRATVLQEIAAWRAEGLAVLEEYTQSNRRTGKRLVLTAPGWGEAKAGTATSSFASLATARKENVVQ
jgi:RecA-family ATPase